MNRIVFRNITLKVENKTILKDISFFVEGFRNIEFESANNDIYAIKALFSLRNISISGDLAISGEVIIDGKRLSLEQYRLLLNRFILFDQRETLRSVLMFVNPEKADDLLEYAPSLADRQMGSLSVGETRIVDLIVNIAAQPPLIFIENIELPGNLRCKYLRLLKRHARETGTPTLVASDYKPFFDGTVVVQEPRIFSVSGKAASARRTQNILSQFSFDEPSNLPEGVDEVPTDSDGEYDYRSCFSAHKCENLIDLARPNPGLSLRLFIYDFYRISVRQAAILALRKYNLMLAQYSDTRNIFNNLRPFIIFLLSIRFFQCFCKYSALKDIIGDFLPVASLFVETSRIQYALLAYFTSKIYENYTDLQVLVDSVFSSRNCMQSLIKGVFRLYHVIFKEGYTFCQFRIVASFLYLCIFSATTSIFEEDRSFIDWYGCILFTPGTYFFAIFLYTCATQLFTFYAIMKIFNIPYAGITLHNIIAANFFFASIRSKRLREFLIACFLSLYLFPSLSKQSKVTDLVCKYIVYLFPPLIAGRSFPERFFWGPEAYLLLLFDLITFVLCTISLSRSKA